MTDTARGFTENHFTSHDSLSVYYKHWKAENPGNTKKAIVLLHRGHEHSGRIAHLVDEMNLPDTDFFAWDARGNGRTEGERGFSPDFSYVVKDLDYFVKHIAKTQQIPVKNITVIAQSLGAVIASTWVHDYAPKIKALIMASPAFNINLIFPLAKQMLQLWHKIKGRYTVKSYVKGTQLTHDVERQNSYHNDPLVSLQISSNILLELYEYSKRIVSDAGAICTPTLLLISGADQVVYKKEQFQFFDNLSSKIKEKYVLDGFFHDTLGEKDRQIPIGLIKNFIQKVEAETQDVNFYDADKQGFTFNEYVELSKPLPALSLKNINFQMTRSSLKHIGKYASRGMNIGETTGHDSGSTLDCVYRNKPEGIGLLGAIGIGKMMDKVYLNSVGWQGIRVRKTHLEKLIGQAIENLQKQNTPIRIVDIAAGHGRYILDAIKPYQQNITSILLRDYSDVNVMAGQNLIKEKNLENIASFVIGDAFDGNSIAEISPKPTLGIVSGLYELFPDNQLLKNSLDGFSRAIETGGYLIYTGQPWHPQVELIARTLSSHRNGKPWVMRRRTQAEMDFLVEKAGFEKLDELIDIWGIFTVSIAKRV
jgi:alpha-beta hydrolase superfamily lysophospholipase/SAM-dependent methyltransferase